MPHYTPLITTIVAALTLAWAFAAVAHKVKLPPLVGYLLAGIVIARSRRAMSPTRILRTSSPRSASSS